MKIYKLNIGYRIALIVALVHFAIVLFLIWAAMEPVPQSGFVLMLLFWLDFFLVPIMERLPSPPNMGFGLLYIFLINGILGSLIWSAIPATAGWFIDYHKSTKIR